MNIEFTVSGSNPSNEGKTFVWKLVYVEIVKLFGIEKSVKRTYYVGGMPQAATIGDKIKANTDDFRIVEREFELEGEVMMLKWIHAKTAMDKAAA
jgi:hypothetical protein